MGKMTEKLVTTLLIFTTIGVVFLVVGQNVILKKLEDKTKNNFS